MCNIIQVYQIMYIYRRIYSTETERSRRKWPWSKCHFNVQLNFNLGWPFPLQHEDKKGMKNLNLSVRFQRLYCSQAILYYHIRGCNSLLISLSSWSSFSRSNAHCTFPELNALSIYFRKGRTGKISWTLTLQRLQPTVVLNWITFTLGQLIL